MNTKENKHTPGKWTQGHGCGRHNANNIYSGNRAICQVYGIWQHTNLSELLEKPDKIEEEMANARLIAASPLMLEALIAQDEAEKAKQEWERLAEEYLNSFRKSPKVSKAFLIYSNLAVKADSLRASAIAAAIGKEGA